MITFESFIDAMQIALERLADKYPDSKKWEVERVHYLTVYDAGFAEPYNDIEIVFKVGTEVTGKIVNDLRIRVEPAKNCITLLENWKLVEEFPIYKKG